MTLIKETKVYLSKKNLNFFILDLVLPDKVILVKNKPKVIIVTK